MSVLAEHRSVLALAEEQMTNAARNCKTQFFNKCAPNSPTPSLSLFS
tara:strand:- start:348 stop:488 length:141 start_codon:yes stop_codon:yes gene_type:complete